MGGSGGNKGTGGAVGSGASGGTAASGGAGGTLAVGNGGKPATGGATGAGGSVVTGGTASGTGGSAGTATTGGAVGSGGASPPDAGERDTSSGGSDGSVTKDLAADVWVADTFPADSAKPADAKDAAPISPGDGAVPVGPQPTAAARALCTTDATTKEISCHFGGAPGNYDVTFVLGGAAAGKTEVQTETLREVLAEVATSVGQTARYSFTLNVREPEGQPVEAVSAGTPGFDMYFLGSAPLLDGIGYATAANPTVLYIAGDSTVCDQTDPAYAGWGQLLPPYFNLGLSVANYADSGESSASFLGSGKLWGAIKAAMKAGDYVLVQFGHNDKTISAADFKTNITAYVTQTKAKNAFPILVTPIARATFSGNTVTAQHQHTDSAGNLVDLPAIIRQVGVAENVPVIDLTAVTTNWLTQVGPEGWQAYHALGTDATHTNRAGAAVNAGFVRDAIVSLNITPLKNFLR
jgi:lysophospholipase L1-like esterase